MKKLLSLGICVLMVLSATSCSKVQGSPMGVEDADSVIIPASSVAAVSVGAVPETPAQTVSEVDSKTKRVDTMRGFTLDFSNSYLVSETPDILRIYPKSSKDEKEGIFVRLVTNRLSEEDFTEQVLKANLDSKGHVTKYGEYKKATLKNNIKLFSHEGIVETSAGTYAMRFVYFNTETQTQIVELCMASTSLNRLSSLDSIMESIEPKNESDVSSEAPSAAQ